MAPRGDDEAIKASEPPILDWSWLQSLNPKHLGKHIVLQERHVSIILNYSYNHLLVRGFSIQDGEPLLFVTI